MRAVPSLREFYPGICLTTEEKARKNLSQGKKNLSQVKKNLSQGKKILSQGKKNLSQGKKNLSPVKKNLSQGKKNLSHGKKNLSQVKKNLSQNTVYILQKHSHITKPSQTHLPQLSSHISHFRSVRYSDVNLKRVIELRTGQRTETVT